VAVEDIVVPSTTECCRVATSPVTPNRRTVHDLPLPAYSTSGSTGMKRNSKFPIMMIILTVN